MELAVGMKVMVTMNVKTDLDVANGSHGEIVDIMLHLEEPEHPYATTVPPAHPSACVLVKLNNGDRLQLSGLTPAVTPLHPSFQTFQVAKGRGNGKGFEVTREQFCLTLAYEPIQ